MYNSIFDIVHTYIYGGGALTSDANLVCTFFSTLACILVLLAPFYVAKKILDFIFETFSWRI